MKLSSVFCVLAWAFGFAAFGFAGGMDQEPLTFWGVLGMAACAAAAYACAALYWLHKGRL